MRSDEEDALNATRTIFALFVLAVALAGCGSGAEAGAVACRPGDEVPCACDDGSTGSRACGAGACDCRTPAVSLQAEPATLDFGEVRQGTSRELVLLLRNPAPREVRLALRFLADPLARFALAPGDPPSAIPAGGSVPLVVQFAALDLGVSSARLRIETDDPAVRAAEVSLVARVSGAVLACMPSPVVFPEVVVGASATAAVICTNAGFATASDPAPLSLDRLEVEGEGFSASWREPPPPGGLAVGASAVIDLALVEPSAGWYQGQLTVGGDAGTQVLPLSGLVREWPACDVEIVPDQLRLGPVDKGGSVTLEFAIRNHRVDAPCVVRAVRLCEGTDEGIVLIGGPFEHVIVPPGEEARFPIRIAPVTEPDENGLSGCVEIELSPDETVSLPIQIGGGGPQEPCSLLAPNHLDFGRVAAGRDTADLELQLINTCSAPLVVGSIEFDEGASPEFFLRSGPPPGTVVQPGLGVDFTVSYRPVDEGDDVGTLFVYDEGHAEPAAATLRGRGGPPPASTTHRMRSDDR